MNFSAKQTSDHELLALAMEYEAGALGMEQIVTWFTYLIERGLIWKLPTDYLDIVANTAAMGLLFPDKALN